ncbi:MAG: hypothetical protein ACYC9Q_08675 [Bacillota bacterium]
MQGLNRDGERASNSVSLLISMLVRYPELATINFDPRRQTLKLTFLLTRVLSEEEFRAFQGRLLDSLAAYAWLEGLEAVTTEVGLTRYGEVSVVEVTRDVRSLSQGEVSLTIDVIRGLFTSALVVDRGESVQEEELAAQEELIEQMLEDLRESRSDKNLIAFREEGRVLVFNK